MILADLSAALTNRYHVFGYGPLEILAPSEGATCPPRFSPIRVQASIHTGRQERRGTIYMGPFLLLRDAPKH